LSNLVANRHWLIVTVLQATACKIRSTKVWFYTNRVVNKWNSLPKWVVSANTTNTFKTRLDKFWQNQDIIYKEPEVVAVFCTNSLSKE